MMSLTAFVRNAGSAVQRQAALFAAALLALFPARARTVKALSFLEYAILAAIIVGVGVALAVFFSDQLGLLQDNVENDLNPAFN